MENSVISGEAQKTQLSSIPHELTNAGKVSVTGRHRDRCHNTLTNEDNTEKSSHRFHCIFITMNATTRYTRDTVSLKEFVHSIFEKCHCAQRFDDDFGLDSGSGSL